MLDNLQKQCEDCVQKALLQIEEVSVPEHAHIYRDEATVLQLKVDGLELVMGESVSALDKYIQQFKTIDNEPNKQSPL